MAPARPPYDIRTAQRKRAQLARLRVTGDVEALCRMVRESDYLTARDAVDLLEDMADPRSVDTLLWCVSQTSATSPMPTPCRGMP